MSKDKETAAEYKLALRRLKMTNKEVAELFEVTPDSWRNTSAKHKYRRIFLKLVKAITAKQQSDGINLDYCIVDEAKNTK